MAISHAKSNTIGDMTGTVTVLNSQGSTVTRAATDFVRPSDWNSVHNQFLTLSGNTANSSAFSGSNIVWQGGNNITLSGTTAAGAATVVISGPNAPAVLSQSGGISNLGNTAGTSGIASGSQVRLLFAGGNNITLSQSVNGASATVTVSAAAQTVESQSFGISNLGNSAGTSGIGSGAQGRFLLAGGNNVTLSQSVNGASVTVTVSAAAQTVESQSFGISNLGNSAGTSGIGSGAQGRFLIAGGNNITLSQSVNGASVTVTISGGAGGGNFSAGNSTDGVGTTGLVGSQVAFFPGANITLSQSINGQSASLSIVGPTLGATGALTVGVSTGGNTSNASGMVSNQLVLAGGNNITLSGSVNGQSMTVTIQGAAGGGAAVTMLSYQPRQLGASTTTAWTNNQIWVQPFRMEPGMAVSASTLMYLQSLGGTYTSAATAGHYETMKWCIYSQNATNNTRFDSMSSGSFTWQVWNSGTSSGSYAYNGATSSSAGTGIFSQISGVRMMNIPINMSITEGLYLLAMALSTTSSNYSALISRYAIYMDAPALVAMGSGFGSAAATSIGFIDAGSYGTTSAAMPSSIGISDIKQHSNLNLFVKFGAI